MKNALATLMVAKLDQARGEWAVKAAHDALLRFLRENQTAWPNWDAYPMARSIFTQRWP